MGLFIIAAVLLLSGLFYVFTPKPKDIRHEVESSSVTAAPTQAPVREKQISLTIKNGELVSGNQVITLTEGDAVTITVTNDAADELHIHGYDKEVELMKDTPAKVTFTANLTGRFPIELHHEDVEIAVLEVQPK
jgi:FtsP/CotA-like multicopper oxidase with cupredoxin domain